MHTPTIIHIRLNRIVVYVLVHVVFPCVLPFAVSCSLTTLGGLSRTNGHFVCQSVPIPSRRKERGERGLSAVSLQKNPQYSCFVGTDWSHPLTRHFQFQWRALGSSTLVCGRAPRFPISSKDHTTTGGPFQLVVAALFHLV